MVARSAVLIWIAMLTPVFLAFLIDGTFCAGPFAPHADPNWRLPSGIRLVVPPEMPFEVDAVATRGNILSELPLTSAEPREPCILRRTVGADPKVKLELKSVDGPSKSVATRPTRQRQALADVHLGRPIVETRRFVRVEMRKRVPAAWGLEAPIEAVPLFGIIALLITRGVTTSTIRLTWSFTSPMTSVWTSAWATARSLQVGS